MNEAEKEVYEKAYTNELTLDYDPKTCVVVGTTTGTLEDFKQWHHTIIADMEHRPGVQYQAGRQRGETVLHQMPEGFNREAWMRHPQNAPEPLDHDDFKAGYWSVMRGIVEGKVD